MVLARTAGERLLPPQMNSISNISFHLEWWRLLAIERQIQLKPTLILSFTIYQKHMFWYSIPTLGISIISFVLAGEIDLLLTETKGCVSW